MTTRLLILITSAAIALAGWSPGTADAQPGAAPAAEAAAAPAPAPAAPAAAAQPAFGSPAAAPSQAPARAVAPRPAKKAPAATAATAPGARVTVVKTTPHNDLIETNGKGLALLFWVFALATVGGAVFVITRRNLIAAVMGMVGSFLGISAVYMLLYANFLAVVQMLVYAGAIMVLFVFVVMILNRPEDEPVAPSGRVGQVIGGAAMLYLVGRLVMLLIHVKAPAGAAGAPGPITVPGTSIQHDWGSAKAVGTDLFGPGIFPFEAISILLLVAVVGAIAIARPLHEDPKTEGDGEGDAGANAGAAS